jgi:hypothetical protein
MTARPNPDRSASPSANESLTSDKLLFTKTFRVKNRQIYSGEPRTFEFDFEIWFQEGRLLRGVKTDYSYDFSVVLSDVRDDNTLNEEELEWLEDVRQTFEDNLNHAIDDVNIDVDIDLQEENTL